MENTQRELEVYETEDGKRPFDEWLDGLRDRKGRAVILVRLDRLEDGNLSDCKSVGKGVHELRIDFGPGYRVYFGSHGHKLVILLCGGDKSSQARDIRAAQTYWEQYNGG